MNTPRDLNDLETFIVRQANEIRLLRRELHVERYTREQHESTISALCDVIERLRVRKEEK